MLFLNVVRVSRIFGQVGRAADFTLIGCSGGGFAEVPHLPGFPEHGILQVFIDGLSYNMGWDFENQSAQAGWRIVYYPELLPESELQTDFSAYQATGSDCLPFSGEFPLIFQTVSEEEEDADFKTLEGHKIGGCPIFIQGDPFWEYHEGIDFNDPAAYSDWQKYILLLQLDSDINENDRYTGKLMWGDSGVANFFITPEDLAKRDFSRTTFMFDCH